MQKGFESFPVPPGPIPNRVNELGSLPVGYAAGAAMAITALLYLASP
jgi:hypothetical protein